MMKWRTGILLLLVLGLTVLFAIACAETQTGNCGDSLTYELDDAGTLTISGTGSMYHYSSTLVSGKYRTTAPWGNSSTAIVDVIIKEGVTNIGNYSFFYCSNLTNITIPNSVTRIGQQAFRNCNSLSNITIPNSVTNIDNYAFYGCSNLTGITIPDSVTNIGGYAFYDCSNLTGITIPASVSSIGNYAFRNCTKLTSITISDNITYISEGAFYNCSGLTSITIPDSVTTIGSYAFYGCTNLTSLTIPDSVTTIGYDAFENCTNLTSVSLLDGVTSIGWDVFYNCPAIRYANLDSNGAAILSRAGISFRVPGTDYDLIYLFNGDEITGLEIWDVQKDIISFVIPDSVTSIGGSAFSGCSNLTSITIPDSVTSIGYEAFYNCNSLTSITIPDSVTVIDISAFSGCTSLTSITIPDSVTSIGNYAFYNCSNLTSITIPDSVTSIGYNAFYNCSSLTSISLLDGVTDIYSWAFDNCPAIKYTNIDTDGARALSRMGYTFRVPGTDYDLIYLFNGDEITGLEIRNVKKDITSFVIPNGVTSIGNSAFSDCSNLTSITIPDSVTTIEDYAFSGCNSLTSIAIPDSVTVIGNSAFSGCTNLTSIAIPNSVTNISEWVFSGCTNLASITIPDSVTTIEGYAFSGCNSLTSIAIPDSVTVIGNSAFSGCTNLATITIPDSVTTIGGSAFSGCSNLTSITIPANVTTVEGYTFYNCSSLTSITIPDSVTSIGYNAFYNCSSLTSISLLDGVADIYSWEFYNCPAIKYANVDTDGARTLSRMGYTFRVPETDYDLIYLFNGDEITGLEIRSVNKDIASFVIPNGVTSIGDSAFSDCSNLTSITIPDTVTTIEGYAFSGCTSLTSITIPNSVKYISEGAFNNCSSLTSVTIPDSVTSIGYSAFNNCSGLTGISIPANVTTIEGYTFYNCSSLTSITIPDSVTSIGYSAFRNCSGLASVSIPASVTTIESYTFYNCTSLTSVTIPECVTSIGYDAFADCINLTSITIPDSVTTIGSYAFSGCTSLTSITIPNSITYISEGVFYKCSGLTSVTIPESVTSIGYSAFRDCSNLSSITIPDSVTSIDYWAFNNCSNLTSITIPANVTSIGDYAFYGSNLQKVAILAETTSFGYDAFGWGYPTIYCYMFSDADSYFTQHGYHVIYLDDTEEASIRTMTIEDDFRMASGDQHNVALNVFPNSSPDIQWSSSNTAVATVENGIVTALAKGSATITAAWGELSENVAVDVFTPATGFAFSEAEIWAVAKESPQITIAAFEPADAEAVFTWKSFDTTIATVDQNGYLTTYKTGDVIISAITESGIRRDCVVHLCYPVTDISLSIDLNPLVVGLEGQLTADVTMRTQSCVNHLVSFSSSDESIATVNENGVVTAIASGEVVLAATAANGKSDSITVNVVTACMEHIIEAIPSVAPTCTESGYTEGSKCARCGTIFVLPTEINPLGHDWGEVSYTWAENNSSVSAERSCLRDAGHTQTETVSVSSAITKPAGCEEMGETTYTTVAFSNTAFAVQSKTEADIQALGHDWRPVTLTWTSDMSTVTGKLVCRRNSNHTVRESAPTTITEIPASCELSATRVYSAQFQMPEFQEYTAELSIDTDPPLGHDWGNETFTLSDETSAVMGMRVCRNDDSHVETRTLSNVLRLPLSLKSVKANAFKGSYMEAVIIPDGCTYIGSYAFAYCPDLRYVRIPASVIEIASNAFEGCTDLVIEYIDEQ